MKTRAHQNGSLALRASQFNLATLAAPKKGHPARIEITWDLGTARHAEYLDCIPVAVARFEKKVASLPGFWRRGTRAGFDVKHIFSPEIVYKLVGEMEKLLIAEEKAI